MKSLRAVAMLIVTFMATLLWPTGDSAQQYSAGPRPGNGKVTWYARISPNNPTQVEVTIDRTKISKNSIVEEIHFDVKFYDAKGNFIGKESFNFTDDTLPYLDSGKHRRRFTYTTGGVRQAKGSELFYTVSPKGTYPSNPHRFVESQTDPELQNQTDGVQEH